MDGNDDSSNDDVEQTMMTDEADYKNDLVEERSPSQFAIFHPPAAAAPRLQPKQKGTQE